MLVLLAVAVAAAEPPPEAHIRGRVMDLDGEPLPYANIEVFRLLAPGDTLGFRANATAARAPTGEFDLEVEPGSYRIRVTYVAYQPKSVTGITVGAGATRELEFRLERRVLLVRGTPARAPRLRDTAEAVLVQQRQAPVVSDAISSEQIRRGGDSNASQALNRVTGLSTVDDRYVFVRGLGERYSATLINRSTIGSPEPNKRVVPLDLIPANLLDNISVQKTYTPDQPAEFGGGTVNISTRDFPGGRTWSVSLTGGFLEGTTGGTYYACPGGKLDFLGVDDGTRDIPDLVRATVGDQRVSPKGIGSPNGLTPDQIETLGRSFNKNWTARQQTAPPNYGVSAAYGSEVKLLGREVGFLLGGTLKGSRDAQEHDENAFNEDEGQLVPRTTYDVRTWTRKVGLNGLASVSCRPGENLAVHLRTIYNRAADDEYRTYEGQNNDSGALLRDTRLRFLSRSIWASTVAVDQTLPRLGQSTLNWRVTYSVATMDEPDRREYQYEWRIGEEGEGGAWELSARSPSMGFTRMYGALDEQERGFAVEWSMPLRWMAREARARIGYQTSRKRRDVAYRRFAFVRPSGGGWDATLPPDSLMVDERIGGTVRDFRLTELTRATDAYTAGLRTDAPYLIWDGPLLPRLRALAGVRVESWLQEARTFDPFSPDGVVIPARLEERDALPCLNLTYALTPAANLRAAWSRTISRPDLRELTPFALSQYESGWVMQGNPDLRRASLQNFDLRAERYFEGEEMLAASLFYKLFRDPIERTLRVVGGGLNEVPFNGEGGRLYGSELEARLSLGRLTPGLRDLALAGNVTLVHSETKLVKEGINTSKRRPLAGQSPYLVNVALFFKPARGTRGVSLLYNRFGSRLDGVGVGGMPDIYERAHGSLDASAWIGIRGLRWTLSAKGLLAKQQLWTQGSAVTRRIDEDRTVSLTVSRSG
jgi:hypothetical protein